MRVKNDRTIVPLAEADRHGHAEEMVAVDEIEAWRGYERVRDGREPCDLDPHRGIIAMHPLLAGSQKTAVENFSQCHAREDAGVGLKVAGRGEVGFGSRRSIAAAGIISDCETNDFR